MKKSYVFMGMLLGVTFLLNNLTLGIASGFFDLVALFSLRPKDFVLYMILSAPMAVINYLNYGAIYATAFSHLQYLPVTLINITLSYEWAPPVVFAIIWFFVVYSTYREIWEIKTAHNLSKRLKIKPIIYNLRPKKEKPKRGFREKLGKRRFQIVRLFLIGNLVVLTIGMIYTSYSTAMDFPVYHPIWESVKNCNFRWQNFAFKSDVVVMHFQGIHYRDPVLVCTTNLPKSLLTIP